MGGRLRVLSVADVQHVVPPQTGAISEAKCRRKRHTSAIDAAQRRPPSLAGRMHAGEECSMLMRSRCRRRDIEAVIMMELPQALIYVSKVDGVPPMPLGPLDILVPIVDE